VPIINTGGPHPTIKLKNLRVVPMVARNDKNLTP
jgi:hypothetical protein